MLSTTSAQHHPVATTTHANGAPPATLGGRIDREWRRLRRRPDALRRAYAWGLTAGPVTDLQQILEATGYGSAELGPADARLRRLVLIAADDELASRVVIQRIVPGLLAVVRRRRRQGAADHAFEELLGAAWIAVRTFNPARKPRCIAAALISDADYRAFRSPGRRRSATERPTDVSEFGLQPAAPPTNPAVELAELFRLATDSGIPDADLDLLRQLLETPTVVELARDLRVTPRTVRNRRDRIALRLREVALAA